MFYFTKSEACAHAGFNGFVAIGRILVHLICGDSSVVVVIATGR